ncbi:hypothetical protein E2C01_007602 [Portunus trituberculatus]|uniref:Uncharacterized protein n=1 Tax=Portunus trituberculatus TaxID=210409 RepID=A0A5B7D0J6_PORTR|nr:hypothetical protein [Portunus trituberculatus]
MEDKQYARPCLLKAPSPLTHESRPQHSHPCTCSACTGKSPACLPHLLDLTTSSSILGDDQPGQCGSWEAGLKMGCGYLFPSPIHPPGSSHRGNTHQQGTGRQNLGSISLPAKYCLHFNITI